MADRVAHVAWAKPGRRFSFSAGLAAVFIVAVALPASGLTTPSSAARTIRASALTADQQSISAKVSALLGGMTVAEKFGQLEMAGPDGPNGTPGDLLAEAKNGQIGSVLDLVGVNNINQVQQQALDSRLGIPLIFGLDVIHGYKTMFPVPLAEASSWTPHWSRTTSPCRPRRPPRTGSSDVQTRMVDISRDPRWAASSRARARIRIWAPRSLPRRFAATRARFQRPDKMAATVKHFAAYGAPVAGRSTTRSTCPPSSCSTTTYRPTRRRSTPAPRP